MQGDRDVGARKAFEEAIIDHPFSAGDRLFRRLANQHERSVPAFFAVSHDGGSGEDRSHVQVVSTGVHYGNVAPGIIFGADLTCVREPCLFLDRKRVQFGAQHDRWTGPILENGDYSSAAYVLCDFIAESA